MAVHKVPIVSDLGLTTGTAGATQTITGVNVPAGSLIYVSAFEKNTSGSNGTISDSVGNSYFALDAEGISGNINDGVAMQSYAFNSKALVGGTITYTKDTSGSFTGVAAFWSTNIRSSANPLDSNSLNVTKATSTNPNGLVPFFEPTFLDQGELVVSSVYWAAGSGDTFTQDNRSGPWQPPPDTLIDTANALGMAGGYMVSNSTVPIPYSTQLNNSRPWMVVNNGFFSQIDNTSRDEDVGMF